MNYTQKTMLIAAIITDLIMTIISGCMETKQKDDIQNNPLQDTIQSINTTSSKSVLNDTTIKVVKFEPNNPCQGCTNLGNFAKETIQTHFLEDYNSGKITYETFNYQDPKNRHMLEKYNVMGSSLCIAVIKDGKEEIIDANDMWEYVWEKEEYIKIFKNKLEEIKK